MKNCNCNLPMESLLHSMKGSWLDSINLGYVSFNGAESGMLSAVDLIKLWHCAFDHSHFTLGPQFHSRNCSCHVSLSGRLPDGSWWNGRRRHIHWKRNKRVSIYAHPFSGSFTFSELITKVCDTFLWALATQIPWNLSTSHCVYMFFYSVLWLSGGLLPVPRRLESIYTDPKTG